MGNESKHFLIAQLQRLLSENGPGLQEPQKCDILCGAGERLWLIGHIDYAKHLGLAYALSDGRFGMLFADKSAIVLSPSVNIVKLYFTKTIYGRQSEHEKDECRKKVSRIIFSLNKYKKTKNVLSFFIRKNCCTPLTMSFATSIKNRHM